MGPRGHLRVSKSYHKEGKSRQRWWGFEWDRCQQRLGVTYLALLLLPDAHSFTLPADRVCTHAPLPRQLNPCGWAWKPICFGQFTEPLSPIFPVCRDHVDVPAWALYSLLTPWWAAGPCFRGPSRIKPPGGGRVCCFRSLHLGAWRMPSRPGLMPDIGGVTANVQLPGPE